MVSVNLSKPSSAHLTVCFPAKQDCYLAKQKDASHVVSLPQTQSKLFDHDSVKVKPTEQITQAKVLQKRFKLSNNQIIEIQRNFRKNYEIKKNFIAVKKELYKLMQFVGEFFKKVPSAAEVNAEDCSPLSDTERNNFLTNRKGNCQEIAFLLYLLIKYDPKIPETIKACLRLGYLSEPDDHSFVVIRHKDPDKNLILDQWLAWVDLKCGQVVTKDRVSSYRPINVFAGENGRSHGFFGPQKKFLQFLNHPDNSQIKTSKTEITKIEIEDRQVIRFPLSPCNSVIKI